jgi:16S rRNA C967 or C1407 C5-methylase (RsmB/RsmF family)
VEFCSARQESLIESAASAVKKGGILVYSTCSFAPEENEAVVNSLLQERPDISLEPLEFGSEGLTNFQNVEFGSDMKKTRRLYPHLHDTTGFFVAKMRVG